MVRKICLNSLYGALGNNYFRYYKLANAEAVTSTGQVTIRWIERKLNQYLNKSLGTEDQDYVIASDTIVSIHPVFSLLAFPGRCTCGTSCTIQNQLCEDKIVKFIDELC